MEWLIDPGPAVSDEVRGRLADQLLSSPVAVIMGAFDGIVVSAAATVLHYRYWFVLLAVAEVVCCVLRLVVIRAISRTRASGAQAPIHRAAFMSIIWCALQGAMAFLAMTSNVATLQILSATMIMGVIGPICARNYPAPRLAMLLVYLCDIPFVAGASTSGNSWLLILLPMTPPFLFGTSQIISSIHTMAVGSLSSEQANRDLARRDPLTGLLNRHGLDEILREVASNSQDAALLYLDLDGFKRINDEFGHHAGDNLLKAVAARLQDASSAAHAIVRAGGDEFIVVARAMSPVQAAALARSLIRLIMAEPYRLDDCPPVWIGVSVGFACYPHDSVDADGLHRKADAALYQSKAAGRGVFRRCGQSDPKQNQPDLISAA